MKSNKDYFQRRKKNYEYSRRNQNAGTLCHHLTLIKQQSLNKYFGGELRSWYCEKVRKNGNPTIRLDGTTPHLWCSLTMPAKRDPDTPGHETSEDHRTPLWRWCCRHGCWQPKVTFRSCQTPGLLLTFMNNWPWWTAPLDLLKSWNRGNGELALSVWKAEGLYDLFITRNAYLQRWWALAKIEDGDTFLCQQLILWG